MLKKGKVSFPQLASGRGRSIKIIGSRQKLLACKIISVVLLRADDTNIECVFFSNAVGNAKAISYFLGDKQGSAQGATVVFSLKAMPDSNRSDVARRRALSDI